MTEDGRVANDQTNQRQNQWLSVRDAADYLGVSQPTIFRWMKEGTLSFYKVGGSTRFAQEGLDAVIEKTTGLKEAELIAGRCAACGHSVLVEGRIRGAGRLYFRPDRTTFWTLSEAMVPTKVRACMACGYIQWHADTEKLRKLKPKPIDNNGRGPKELDSSENSSDTIEM